MTMSLHSFLGHLVGNCHTRWVAEHLIPRLNEHLVNTYVCRGGHSEENGPADVRHVQNAGPVGTLTNDFAELDANLRPCFLIGVLLDEIRRNIARLNVGDPHTSSNTFRSQSFAESRDECLRSIVDRECRKGCS